jgi:2,6-dioxo-6-phenylhexa-3-enoate hydrolase
VPQALTAEGTSRTVQTRNWKIHYHEAGAGHPILMLHGSCPGTGGWSDFGPTVNALAGTFRTIAADMPGWGASDPVPAAERDHVEAARELLDALGIERAALIGNSMGGFNAVAFAVKYPERISHLITIGSGVREADVFAAGDGPSEGLKILLRAYRDPSPAMLRELGEFMAFDSAFVTEELINTYSEAARRRPDHLTNFLSNRGAKPRRSAATPPEIAGVRTPSLIFHGHDDRVVSYESSLRLVTLIAGSRLVLMDRCGHWLQFEHAAEFHRLVADFVADR